MKQPETTFFWYTFADGHRIYSYQLSAYEERLSRRRHGKMVSKIAAQKRSERNGKQTN